MKRRIKFAPGAIRPGFMDLLTALILLSILAYAAFLQFPAYRHSPSATPAAAPSS